MAASISATAANSVEQRHVEPRLRDRTGDDFLERADVPDGQVAVERVDGAPGRFRKARGRRGGLHQDRHPRNRPLGVGQIDLGRIRLGKTGVLDVADDADDLTSSARFARAAAPPERDLLADRILTREVLASRRFRNEDDLRRIRPVVASEEATLLQRNTDRLEVVGGRHADLHRRLLRGRDGRASGNFERQHEARAAQWQRVHAGNRLHARERLQLRQQLVEKRHLAQIVLIPDVGQRHLESKGRLHRESGIDRRELAEAADQEARTGEQRHGERNLGDHQGRPHA